MLYLTLILTGRAGPLEFLGYPAAGGTAALSLTDRARLASACTARAAHTVLGHLRHVFAKLERCHLPTQNRLIGTAQAGRPSATMPAPTAGLRVFFFTFRLTRCDGNMEVCCCRPSG